MLIHPKNPAGLSALPVSWLAMGKGQGTVTSEIARAEVNVDREFDRLVMDAINPVYPDLACSDLGQGKVRLVVDMPWPVKDLTLSGPMDIDGDRVILRDDNGSGMCELTRPQPGQIRGVIREGEVERSWFLYEAKADPV